MHIPHLRRQKWLGLFLSFSFLMPAFMPATALANGNSNNNNHDSSSHGRVPDPDMIVDMMGFKLASTYGENISGPSAAGTWADANNSSTSLKNYVEGSCVPVLAKVKNNGKKKGDLNVTLTFDHQADFKLGIDDLEAATPTVAPPVVDNLNDFTYTHEPLTSISSFAASNGSSVMALVQGPYSGENTGSAPARKTNGTRHYNVKLDNVDPGVTVYVTGCARLSSDPKKSFDYDHDDRDGHYGLGRTSTMCRRDDEDDLDVQAIVGGRVVDQVIIDKNHTLNLPSLTLVPKVNGTGARPDQFTFHVNPSIRGQDTFVIAPGKYSVKIPNVPPQGSYTITETGPSGFSVTSGSGTNCTFSGSTATASPAAGLPPKNAKCIFVNGPAAPQQATLTVTKVVVNNNGGTKTITDFPLFVNGVHVTSSVPVTYAPGNYVVTEESSDEYQGTFSGACDATGNVTLAAGENKTCILTNDDLVANLVVTKIVVNNNGGTKTSADFSLFVDDQPVTSTVATAFGPGVHVVTELADPGYLATFSGACDATGNVTLVPGQTKYCTITNDDIAPLLTITKVVVNDNGGVKTIQDFPLFVNGNPVSSGVTLEYAPGTYHVTETVDPTYTGAFSGDCDVNGNVTLQIGEAKNCVITNDDKPTTLKVTVNVVNDNGGTRTIADFPMTVNGNPVTPGTEAEVTPGFYTIAQSVTNGYSVAFSGACNSFGVATVLAQTANECIVTFNDPSASLTIVNNVINNNGQSLTSADFPATIDGSSAEIGTEFGVSAGMHRVISAGNGYYVTTYGGDCDISGFVTLHDGDHKTCIITNDDAAPGLTIVTHVINDNGGTAVAADFIALLQAIGSPTQPLNGSETGLLIENSVGFFGVGQAFLPTGGYNVSFQGDCFGVINPGDTRVCTIIDDDIAPQLLVVTDVVNDNGGTAIASDFTVLVTGSNVSTPAFAGDAGGVMVTLNAGAYSVQQALSSLPYNLTLSAECAGTLSVGQVATCTITNNDN